MGIKERLARRYQVVTVSLEDGTQATGTQAEIDAYFARRRGATVAQINQNPQTPKPNVLPPSQRPRDASTGETTRLSRCCRHCRDELPPGARFCITCGKPV